MKQTKGLGDGVLKMLLPNRLFKSMRTRPLSNNIRSIEPIDPEGWDMDPGRPLVLLLLALLGTLSFLSQGISSLLPILQHQGSIPEGNSTKHQPIT